MLADMPRSQSVSNRMLTQDGVISRAQAAALGIGPARARYWCEVGRWVAVHPGVYRTAETTLSDRARIRAASLWGGSRAWVSGAAAVYWWGYTEIPPSQVELIVPRSRYLKPPPGIVVRRADLDPLDVICHDRVPITQAPYSALYGSVALGAAGPAMLDRALQKRVPMVLVEQVLGRYPRTHWARQARAVLAAARDGEAQSERLLVAELRAAGIGGWVLGHRVTLVPMPAILDLAFVSERVAIEVDGWAWHHTPERFRRDRQRQNALMLAGWKILRFTWFDLTERPSAVIAEIRDALAAARACA